MYIHEGKNMQVSDKSRKQGKTILLSLNVAENYINNYSIDELNNCAPS